MTRARESAGSEREKKDWLATECHVAGQQFPFLLKSLQCLKAGIEQK